MSDPKPEGATLPPWIWFWLFTYALTFPGVVGFWRQSLDVLSLSEELPAGFVTVLHVFFLSNAPQLISSVALILGILTIFAPQIRAAYLERRFRLTEPHQASPALKEIGDFVCEHAPGIRIKANLLRADQLAFVYPIGYRKTALALFGGLIILWRSDRQAAEAVLLHEIAHYRHGDALVVGAGSFFEALAKYWLVVCSLPFVLALIDDAMISLKIKDELGYGFFMTLLGFVLWFVPAIFLELISTPFWLVSALVLPLMGIWCAELNADKFVTDTQKSPDALIGALDKLSPAKSWWRWFLFRVYHPPRKLRRWMALRSRGTLGLVALLLVFPLAYVAKLLAMSGWALFIYLSMCIAGCGDTDVSQELGANVGYVLERDALVWLSMAVLLLAWPVATGYWGRLFGGEGDSTRSNYKGYVLSGSITGILAVIAYGLRFSG